MKKINIGFDIDGVLRALFPYATIKFLAEHPGYIPFFKDFKDIDDYNIEHWLISSLSKEKRPLILGDFKNFIFHNKSCYDIYSSAPMHYDAQNFNEIARELKFNLSELNIDANIVIITSQVGIEQRLGTIDWLNMNDIKYDGLIFSCNKGNFALDYILEDNAQNAKAVRETGGTSVLRLQPYNKKHDEEFAYTATNIQQYVNHILEIEKEKL